eukprot:5363821-Pleurochrysis_carterae.AAC.2
MNSDEKGLLLLGQPLHCTSKQRTKCERSDKSAVPSHLYRTFTSSRNMRICTNSTCAMAGRTHRSTLVAAYQAQGRQMAERDNPAKRGKHKRPEDQALSLRTQGNVGAL